MDIQSVIADGRPQLGNGRQRWLAGRGGWLVVSRKGGSQGSQRPAPAVFQETDVKFELPDLGQAGHLRQALFHHQLPLSQRVQVGLVVAASQRDMIVAADLDVPSLAMRLSLDS